MKRLAMGLSLIGAVAGTMMGASTAFAATNGPTDIPATVTHSPTYVPASVQSVTASAQSSPSIAIQPLGTRPPSSFWNLSGGNDYSAAFQDVSNAGIYTNYYFDSDNGSLYVKNINLYGYNASSVPCEIDLWDKTTGQELHYTSLTTDTGNTYEIHYTGLNTNDQYYVGVKSDAVNKTISGNFKVSWSA